MSSNSFETSVQPLDAPPLAPVGSPPSPSSPALPPPRYQAPQDRPRRTLLMVAGASGVAAGLVASLLTVAITRDDRPSSAPPRPTPVSTVSPVVVEKGPAPSQLIDSGLDIQQLLDKARPSVVSIEVAGFGVGSGFIISADGQVVTNAHVLGDATQMRVRLASGERIGATLVGIAPDKDLALIKLDSADALVPAVLGDSEALRVGDDVVAIGNALGLSGDPTVTRGVVSAKNRTIEEQDGAIIDGAIQTDAAINPGNSGGPLFNAAGQVVGINTAIRGDSQNIGFAIAVDTLVGVLDELRGANGGVVEVDRTFLGVQTQDVITIEPDTLELYGIEVEDGAVVGVVTGGSGADKAGVQEGDVIIRIDDTVIATSEELGRAIRARQPGDQIELELIRRGQNLTVTATLAGR
jgi:S1-C subfamily serine protease